MNINYKPSQIELFPANAQPFDDVNKPRFLFANLSLSIESLVILTILVIMVTLFSFAIGVEHGKRSVAQALDERVAQAWNVKRPVQPVKAMVPVAPATIDTKNFAQSAGNRGFVAAKQKTAVKQSTALTAATDRKVSKELKQVAKVAPVAVGSARSTLQLATYRSEKFARDEAIVLRGKGIKTFLIKSGDFWLVCTGQFKSKEEATGFIPKLPAKYRQAQVRRF